MLTYTIIIFTLNQIVTLVHEESMEYKCSMLRDLS